MPSAVSVALATTGGCVRSAAVGPAKLVNNGGASEEVGGSQAAVAPWLLTRLRSSLHRVGFFGCLFAVLSSVGAAHGQVPSNPYDYKRTTNFAFDPATGFLTSEITEPTIPALCRATSYA